MVNRLGTVVYGFFCFLLLFKPAFEQMEPLSSPAERVALLQLRSTLGLRAKEWPIKGGPCTTWVGVECKNGRVVGLNISRFRRTRIGKQNPRFAVDALANLTLLASFNASGFLLPGSIPDWFGQSMMSLKVLDLRSCYISGSIPPSLGNLTNLTGLYLAENFLTGSIPFSFGQLSRLSVLDLSQNSLTGFIPPLFGALGNLSRLDISSNFLSGSIPPEIGTLSKLQYLNMSDNSLYSSIPAQLGNLSSLVDLDLSFNSLSGSLLEDLRGLRNLQRVILGNNLLGGALSVNVFSNPSQLQVVVLRRNNFSGSVPDVLWSMPELHLLDISDNNFSGQLPDISLNGRATATLLNISYNIFFGNITPALQRFSSIDLSGNYFEGTVPEYVHNKTSFDQNCLHNATKQRTLKQCRSFYGERGLIFDNFGMPNSTQASTTKTRRKSNKKIIILAVAVGAAGLIVILGLLLIWLLVRHCKRGITNQRSKGTEPVPDRGGGPPPGLAINFSTLGDAFTYQQLLQATNDFSDANLIKHGHSGDLFRGALENGIPVVIKRVNLLSTKKESYLLELDFFSKVSHMRLVPLLGHCLENENEKFLVYKYMLNEDLSNSMYRKTTSEEGDGLQSLDWITRLKIAIGAAEGLSYLHHECTPPLVHRDVQASSIFLDDKYEVRLGSLTEICAQEEDTHQSVITRLLRFPQSSDQGTTSGSPPASCAYDVYCFGKVLLELVTGKLGISAWNDAQLKEWLEQTLPYISIHDRQLVTKIVDPTLIIDEDLLEEVWSMAIVARSCLNPKGSRRPLMRYILQALENPLKVVRDDSNGSERFKAASSRGSWNATLFGSWRQSSTDVMVIPATSTQRLEAGTSGKQQGTAGSQGSGQNAGNSSSSRRRHSTEIFPEPVETEDFERQQIQD